MDGERHPTEELGQQLRRERLLDLEQRIAPHRRRAFAVLAVTLLAAGPWLGWWWLIPLALAGASFAAVDRLMPASPYPGRWVAAGWAVSPLMIAISTALTGGASSPAIAWFALPAVTLASRFERRGVMIGAAYIGALMLACTALLEPGEVADDPTPLLFAGALVIGTLMFSGAVVESDRDHRRSAVVDPLTGLLNRAALAQRVDEDGGGLGGPGREAFGMLIADLDHFKRINDEHGHARGDAVLRDVAYAIRGSLRSFDLAYRIGGEEFLVLLPGADRAGLVRVAERLREAVAACSRPGIEVRMSVGGACTEGIGSDDFSTLSGAADAALYEAKRAGRDRVLLAGELNRERFDGLGADRKAELGIAPLRV